MTRCDRPNTTLYGIFVVLCICISGLILYFFGYKTEGFHSKTIPKNLDPSNKTDLDLWDSLERLKPIL